MGQASCLYRYSKPVFKTGIDAPLLPSHAPRAHLKRHHGLGHARNILPHNFIPICIFSHSPRCVREVVTVSAMLATEHVFASGRGPSDGAHSGGGGGGGVHRGGGGGGGGGGGPKELLRALVQQVCPHFSV